MKKYTITINSIVKKAMYRMANLVEANKKASKKAAELAAIDSALAHRAELIDQITAREEASHNLWLAENKLAAEQAAVEAAQKAAIFAAREKAAREANAALTLASEAEALTALAEMRAEGSAEQKAAIKAAKAEAAAKRMAARLKASAEKAEAKQEAIAASLAKFREALKSAERKEAVAVATANGRVVTVRRGKAHHTRSRVVYQGKALKKQVLTISGQTRDGSFWWGEAYEWAISRQADCQLIRDGIMKPALFAGGWVTNKNGAQLVGAVDFSDDFITLSIGRAKCGKVKLATMLTELDSKYIKLILKGQPYLFALVGDDKWYHLTPHWTNSPVANVNVAGDWAVKAALEGRMPHGLIWNYSQIHELAAWEYRQHAGDIKNGHYPMPFAIYANFMTSASQARKGDLELMKIWDISNESLNLLGDHDRVDAIRCSILNKVGGNMHRMIKKAYADETEMPANKLVKLWVRLGLPLTNSAQGAPVRACAFYAGSWTDEESGIAAADGHALVSEDLLKRTHALHKASVDRLFGVGIQGRYAATKFFAIAGDEETIVRIVTRKHGVEGVMFVNNTDKDAMEAAQIMVEKKDPTVKGKYIVFGPTGTADDLKLVDIVADLNARKTVFEATPETNFVIMEEAHLSHDGVATSKQVWGGCISSPLFSEAIEKKLRQTVEKAFLLDKHEGDLKASDLANDTYAMDLIKKIRPEYIMAHKPLANRLADSVRQTVMNAINDCHFNVDGYYAKGVPDLGVFFDVRLLEKDEFYLHGSRFDGVAVVVRHPKMAAGEYCRMRQVSAQTLLERIDKMLADGTIEEIDKRILSRFVKFLQPGSVMLPFWDKDIANKLGGADMDGDGFAIIFDEDIIKCYESVVEEAVDQGGSEASKKMYAYNDSVASVAYFLTLVTGNEEVGKLVTWFYTMRMVLEDIRNGILTQERWELFLERKPWLKVTQQGFVTPHPVGVDGAIGRNTKTFFTKGEEEYIPVTKPAAQAGQAVSLELIEKMGENAYKADMTNLKNFRRYLEDLEVAGPTVVGKTLDAVKNLFIVPVPTYCIHTMFVGGINTNIAYKDGVLTLRKPGIVRSEFNQYQWVYLTRDKAYDMKTLGLKILQEKLNDLCENAGKTAAIVKSGNIDKTASAYKGAEFLGQLCSKMWKASMASATCENAYSPVDEMKAHFVSFYRNMTANMSPAERLRILIKASVLTRTDGSLQAGSLPNLFGGEQVLNALDYRTDENDTPIVDKKVVEPIFVMDEEILLERGRKINLVEGASEELGIYTEKRVTGKFEAAMVNGKACAITTVKEQAESWIQESMAENLMVVQVPANTDTKELLYMNGKTLVIGQIPTGPKFFRPVLMDKNGRVLCQLWNVYDGWVNDVIGHKVLVNFVANFGEMKKGKFEDNFVIFAKDLTACEAGQTK